ncbi:MAG: hypothetical protein JW999_07715, partial [Methanotrichaceae archaeon]|nr:hypothetical protein [Methanotrichaceae archaeon]
METIDHKNWRMAKERWEILSKNLAEITKKWFLAVSHGKPHKNKSERRLSTSLRWPFPADLDP